MGKPYRYEHGNKCWNVAHVRNAINAYGRVPEDKKQRSVELLDSLLSDHINISRQHHDLRKAMYALKRMHAEVGLALIDNDLLRIRALITDWEKEFSEVW